MTKKNGFSDCRCTSYLLLSTGRQRQSKAIDEGIKRWAGRNI